MKQSLILIVFALIFSGCNTTPSSYEFTIPEGYSAQSKDFAESIIEAINSGFNKNSEDVITQKLVEIKTDSASFNEMLSLLRNTTTDKTNLLELLYNSWDYKIRNNRSLLHELLFSDTHISKLNYENAKSLLSIYLPKNKLGQQQVLARLILNDKPDSVSDGVVTLSKEMLELPAMGNHTDSKRAEPELNEAREVLGITPR